MEPKPTEQQEVTVSIKDEHEHLQADKFAIALPILSVIFFSIIVSGSLFGAIYIAYNSINWIHTYNLDTSSIVASYLGLILGVGGAGALVSSYPFIIFKINKEFNKSRIKMTNAEHNTKTDYENAKRKEKLND
jgi:hypothetical protein